MWNGDGDGNNQSDYGDGFDERNGVYLHGYGDECVWTGGLLFCLKFSDSDGGACHHPPQSDDSFSSPESVSADNRHSRTGSESEWKLDSNYLDALAFGDTEHWWLSGHCRRTRQCNGSHRRELYRQYFGGRNCCGRDTDHQHSGDFDGEQSGGADSQSPFDLDGLQLSGWFSDWLHDSDRRTGFGVYRINVGQFRWLADR